MSDERGAYRGIVWQDQLPWLILFRAFWLAREFPKLILSAAALLLTAVGWKVLGAIFSGDSQVARLSRLDCPTVWRGATGLPQSSEMKSVISSITERLGLESLLSPSDLEWLAHNPMLDVWLVLSRPFRQLFDGGLTVTAFAYLLLCGIWMLAVWALFGGAVTRIAAIEFAREELLPASKGLAHARTKWLDYFTAPLLPFLLVVFVVVGTSLVSWLLRFDAGTLLAGLAWPAILVGGFVVVVMALGLVVGWPLMWTTISVEGQDCFDAISRTYAYVYRRPLHYIAYSALAMINGILGWLLAASFAAAVVYMAIWTSSWAAGAERTDRTMRLVPKGAVMIAWPGARADNGTKDEITPATSASSSPGDADANKSKGVPVSTLRRGGITLIAWCMAGVKLLAVAFAYSYFWTATTAIYFLLRRDVDAEELDSVYVDDQPVAYGLPPLKTDEAGVPNVADEGEQELTGSGATGSTSDSVTETEPAAGSSAGPATKVDEASPEIDERAENDGG